MLSLSVRIRDVTLLHLEQIFFFALKWETIQCGQCHFLFHFAAQEPTIGGSKSLELQFISFWFVRSDDFSRFFFFILS